jgi:integrase
MATWNKAKNRWQASLGTGANRVWFYSKKPGKEGESEAEQLKDLYLNGPAPLRPGSLNEFFENIWWPQVNLDHAGETIRAYLSHFVNDIEPNFGNALLREITPLKVQAWVNAMRQAGGNPKTIRNKYTTLSSMITAAWRLGLVPEPLKGKIILPKVVTRHPRKELTPELRRRILESVHDLHHFGPVWAMSTFGMRRNEALGLRPCDVEIQKDFAIITLKMNRQRTGTKEQLKSRSQGEHRWFAVPIALAKELLSFQTSPDPFEFLFLDPEGKPIKPETMSTTCHERFKKAGIGIQVKELRNLAISNMRRAGVSDTVRMDIVGHKDQATHLGYQDKTALEFVDAFTRLMTVYDSPESDK